MYPGVSLKDDTVETPRNMQEELDRLHSSMDEMRKAQKSMQGMISEVTGMCIQLINEVAADQVEAEIMYMLVRRPVSLPEIARKLNIPESMAGDELESMRIKGLVRYGAGLWRI
jgi:ArsR family transcriptional regulator